MQALLHAAIARGAPLFNAGDVAGCSRLYTEAANTVLSAARAADLTELSSLALRDALASLSGAHTAADAWALRHVFDDMLADARFVPAADAPLPREFPPPGPVGRVVEKSYPRYRAARADGGRGAFGPLFRHISAAGVAMTAPVLSRLHDAGAAADMAFVYPAPALGATGAAPGGVTVLDALPERVLSIGVRGDVAARLALARRIILARLELGDLLPAGEWRTCAYNGPMTPLSASYWELQLPVVASAV